MPEEFNSFAPGGNVLEGPGTIVACSFDKGDSNQNWSAHFTLRGDEGDETETFCGLGSDWASYDGGRSVEHPKGEKRRFNAQTAYAEWLVFAAGGFDGDVTDKNAKPLKPDWENENGWGAAKLLAELDRNHQGRGSQFAEVWEGLRFEFAAVTRPSRERKVLKAEDGSALLGADGKEVVEWIEGERIRQLPVKFLGVAGQQQAMDVGQSAGGQTTSATSSSTTAPTPPSTPTNATPPTPANPPAAASNGVLSHPALSELPNQDRLKVVKLAKENDFGGFIDQTMALQVSDGRGMMDVASVMDALADEGFYNALRG